MNFDENDLISTNKFIRVPTFDEELPENIGEEFRKFYKDQEKKRQDELLQKKIEMMNVNDIVYMDETDEKNLINTNGYKQNTFNLENNEILERNTKEIVSYVSIDSRDRNKKLFDKANNFKIFLGRTFYNVKQIKLSRIEFPNTDAVINSSNNRIYWINKEDVELDIIDSITNYYPIYSIDLRIGTYTATTLQREIQSKMNLIKRQNKTDGFHSFIVNLDIETDIVTFTSLISRQLANNPLATTINTGVITVTDEDHGYSTGDSIYLENVKTTAGIPASLLTGFHEIVVINQDTYRFEVNINASETVLGGGNTVKSGKVAPFQLLFGEYENQVYPNIGFPNENSSQPVSIYFKSIDNFYTVKINLDTSHNLDPLLSIGEHVTISSTTFVDGTRNIIKILTPTTLIVSISNPLDFGIYNTGQITINNSVINIVSIENNDIKTVILQTFTDNFITKDKINTNIILYKIPSIPTFTGTHRIYSLLDNDKIILQGSILNNGGFNYNLASDIGKGGYMSFLDPIHSTTLKIVNVIPGSPLTTFEIEASDHVFKIGDRIKINNLETTPSIYETTNGILTIFGILNSTTFTVNITTTNISNIESSWIGIQTLELNFPHHGFNSIFEIKSINNPPYNVEISTLLPHNLVSGDKIRISKTNSIPVIDGFYTINKIDNDTFQITFPGGITTNGTIGDLGMNNDFYLYGVSNIGDIKDLNNTKFSIREIKDEHTITFDCREFTTITGYAGGSNIFVNSLKHGFNGIQTNTKNDKLFRSINLEGENYVFITSPQLSTMINTGNVNNIFARITLDQSPGSMVFNYLSNPKIYEPSPLPELNELEFSVLNYNNTFYDFNDLDYSFVLEITEIQDISNSFNYSSKRGVHN